MCIKCLKESGGEVESFFDPSKMKKNRRKIVSETVRSSKMLDSSVSIELDPSQSSHIDLSFQSGQIEYSTKALNDDGSNLNQHMEVDTLLSYNPNAVIKEMVAPKTMLEEDVIIEDSIAMLDEMRSRVEDKNSPKYIIAPHFHLMKIFLIQIIFVVTISTRNLLINRA